MRLMTKINRVSGQLHARRVKACITPVLFQIYEENDLAACDLSQLCKRAHDAALRRIVK